LTLTKTSDLNSLSRRKLQSFALLLHIRGNLSNNEIRDELRNYLLTHDTITIEKPKIKGRKISTREVNDLSNFNVNFECEIKEEKELFNWFKVRIEKDRRFWDVKAMLDSLQGIGVDMAWIKHLEDSFKNPDGTWKGTEIKYVSSEQCDLEGWGPVDTSLYIDPAKGEDFELEPSEDISNDDSSN